MLDKVRLVFSAMSADLLQEGYTLAKRLKRYRVYRELSELGLVGKQQFPTTYPAKSDPVVARGHSHQLRDELLKGVHSTRSRPLTCRHTCPQIHAVLQPAVNRVLLWLVWPRVSSRNIGEHPCECHPGQSTLPFS